MHSHATKVILLLTFPEWCSTLCSTSSWAEDRMVNEVYEGFRLCFYCVQGIYIARPILYRVEGLHARVDFGAPVSRNWAVRVRTAPVQRILASFAQCARGNERLCDASRIAAAACRLPRPKNPTSHWSCMRISVPNAPTALQSAWVRSPTFWSNSA
jgi:hypothetical protein